MLGQIVANLIVPGDPEEITLKLPSSEWVLTRHPDFLQAKQAIAQHQCAETYFLESEVDLTNSSKFNAAWDELTPIFLASSYATGLTVTSNRATMSSEAKQLFSSEHWPRVRAMDAQSLIINSDSEFCDLVERFVLAWPAAGVTEKARLLIHHWLDSIVCWSMEDLYLSATTLLQIIVATEEHRQGGARLTFYDGVEAAANRFGLNVLTDDFKNMRNELVHSGQLIGHRFAGPDKEACSRVICEVMNWLDDYIHAALALGSVRKRRFRPMDFINLNAYSIG